MRTDELKLLTKTTALLTGATFKNSEVAESLCCPSRATFLTGQYPHNHRVLGNNDGWLLDENDTLNVWLHNAGYSTGLIGKYLNGYACSSPIPPGWDEWHPLCKNIYGMYKYTLRDGNALTYFGQSPDSYQTDVLASRARDVITNQALTGQPFFTWITPTAPHSGPGRRYADRYAKSLATWSPSRSASFGEANVLDKPAWIQRIKPFNARRRALLIQAERNRGRMLLAVDDLVQTVVSALRDSGQLEHSVIVFTSDNGFMNGEHRVGTGKEIAYNESLRVPLLIAGPGVPEAEINDLVGNIDIAPTIAQLAGASHALEVDGRSLVPLLVGEERWPKRALYHRVAGDPTDDGLTGHHPSADVVTTERFKYSRLATNELELYDLASDPDELVNVASAPRYGAVVGALEQLRQVMRSCHGSSCDRTLGNVKPDAVATVRCGAYFECDFDASHSSDLDGSVSSIVWDFGDGTVGEGAVTSHTYEQSGTYDVMLTIRDDLGLEDRTVIMVAGAANLPPTAIGQTTCVDLSCTFDASASVDPDGYIKSYRWQFGDGKSATSMVTSHAYESGGDYTAALLITDDRGKTSRILIGLHATAPNRPPIAVGSVNCDGLACAFDGSASTDPDGDVAEFLWDFGDGTYGAGPTAAHTYASGGVYAATLIVTDGNGLTSEFPSMLDVTVADPAFPLLP